MDYSLLLGIHDIIRGSDPEEEGPVREEESEGDGDCGLTGPPALVGSYGTSPEGIGGYIHSHRPLGPGEFESFIDVYAIRSAEGERGPGNTKGVGRWGGGGLALGNRHQGGGWKGCLAFQNGSDWFWGEGIGTTGALHCRFLSPGAPQKEVYFMGLIDILTQYDAKKKAAHAAKTVKHGVRVPQSLSCLDCLGTGSLLCQSSRVAKGRRAGDGSSVEWTGGWVVGKGGGVA